MLVVGRFIRVCRILGLVDDAVMDCLDLLISGRTGHLLYCFVHLGSGVFDSGGVQLGSGQTVFAGCAVAACRTWVEGQGLVVRADNQVLHGVQPENFRVLIKNHLQGTLECSIYLLLGVSLDADGDLIFICLESAQEGIVHAQCQLVFCQLGFAQVILFGRAGRAAGFFAAGTALLGLGGWGAATRFAQSSRGATAMLSTIAIARAVERIFLNIISPLIIFVL